MFRVYLDIIPSNDPSGVSKPDCGDRRAGAVEVSSRTAQANNFSFGYYEWREYGYGDHGWNSNKAPAE